MVDGEVAEFEDVAAAGAAPFLEAEEGVLLGAVGRNFALVRAPGDVLAVDEAIQQRPLCLDALADELGGEGGEIDAGPPAVEAVGGDAGGGAADGRGIVAV